MSNDSILARLQEPIQDDLQRFRSRYRETLESGIFVIDRVVSYLMRTHGKGLRPVLTLLSAKLGNEEISDDTIRAAVIVELLHEATLVHDDVVDEAETRRNWPSLPARFRNKVSVLFGDYMLANVLASTLEARDLRWLDILSETARRMAKGELVQAARSKRVDMTEVDYLAMIGDKTAALFNACCRMGALTGGLDDEQVNNLGRYGEHLGVAFQIKDDLLDLFGGDGIGKPVGGDLKERKLTLPLLAILNSMDKREARRIRAKIKRGIRKREISDIARLVREKGGEEYASNVMYIEAEKSRNALNSLPPSKVKDLLNELVDFAIRRGK